MIAGPGLSSQFDRKIINVWRVEATTFSPQLLQLIGDKEGGQDNVLHDLALITANEMKAN